MKHNKDYMSNSPYVMPLSVPKEYQTSRKNHSLEVISVVLLVFGIGLFVYFNAKINTREVTSSDIPVIPLPPSDSPSLFSSDIQLKIRAIQIQIQRGEVTFEDGARQIDGLLNQK